MATGLLGDTLFLDQLQKTSEILGGQVQNVNPFGNYNPTLASDFVNTPFGVPVAQNRFVGNQFQMPDLTGSTYTPGNLNLGNFGSYTPMPFNQGNVATTTTQPGLLAGNQRSPMAGSGGDRLDDRLGGGVGLERIANMNLSIDPLTGRIEVLDPSSISSSLLTDLSAIQKFTPAGLLNQALGGSDYGKQLDRIEQQYGKAVADEIAATVRESYGPGKATPSGVLSTGLQIGDKVDLGSGIKGFINQQGKFQRGTPVGEINKPTPAPAPAPTPKKQPKQEGPKDRSPGGNRPTGGQGGKFKGTARF